MGEPSIEFWNFASRANARQMKEKKQMSSNLDYATRSVKYQIGISLHPNKITAVKTFRPRDVNNVEDLQSLILNYVWTPAIYKNDRRANENFLGATHIGIDVDNALPLTQAIEMVKDWQVFALIGLTKSHQLPKGSEAPCDRYRVVLRASSVCTDSYQYEYNLRLYMKAFCGDKSCKDPARLFNPCRSIAFVNNGMTVDWQIAPPKPKQTHIDSLARYKKTGTIPAWIIKQVEQGVPPGGNGSPGRHAACRDIAKALTVLGYSLDEIVDFICTGPLLEIGRKDIEHQADWGRRYGIKQINESSEKKQDSNGAISET